MTEGGYRVTQYKPMLLVKIWMKNIEAWCFERFIVEDATSNFMVLKRKA